LDIFDVSEQFREKHPQEFEHLSSIPASFQKIHFDRSRPVYMTFNRPHIVLNNKKQVCLPTL